MIDQARVITLLCKPDDTLGGRKGVARQRQGVGVIVKTVACGVGRQHGSCVDIEGEKIVDGIAIFGAVQALPGSRLAPD